MGHFLRTVCWLQPRVTDLTKFPEGSTDIRWYLWGINVSWSIFVHFIWTSLENHLGWLVSRCSCWYTNQVKDGSFQGALKSVRLTCIASVELLRSDLKTFCFHKQFLSQMWISDFLFHLQYAIYKHHRSEGTEPLDRSRHCHAPCLTHARSSKQNTNFCFPVFPIYLAQLIHIVLQKVAVEQQLLLILWVKREYIEKLLDTQTF